MKFKQIQMDFPKKKSYHHGYDILYINEKFISDQLYKSLLKVMKSMNGLIIMLAILTNAFSQRLICYSKTSEESQIIYKYFLGNHDGFFIDINPEFPIENSNTIYLRSQGWSGLNLLASNEKVLEFSKIRGDEKNVFFQSQIIHNKNLGTQSAQNIATSMSQICKDANRKPSFLTTSIKYLPIILSSNDWQKQICRPSLIVIREDEPSEETNQKNYQSLRLNGYEKAEMEGQVSVFIQKNATQQMREMKQKNKAATSNQPIAFSQILGNLTSKYRFNSIKIKGNILGDKAIIHFAKYNSSVDIRQILKQVPPDKLTQMKEISIIIMQFNPLINTLIVQSNSYSIDLNTLKPTQKYYHLNYKSQNQQNKQIHIYLFDHQFVEIDEKQIKTISVIQKKQSNEQQNIGQDEMSVAQKQKKEQQQLATKDRGETTMESKRWGSGKIEIQQGAPMGSLTIKPKIGHLSAQSILNDKQMIQIIKMIGLIVIFIMGLFTLIAILYAYIKNKRSQTRRRISRQQNEHSVQNSQNKVFQSHQSPIHQQK